MPFYRERNKKKYVITKTIVSARLFFYRSSYFFFFSFIFFDFFLFYSILAFDFVSKIESEKNSLRKNVTKKFFIFGFSFCPFLCPFLFVSKNNLIFPYCSISLISVVWSLFISFQKIVLNFSLFFQYLQRYTQKEQASKLVSF